MKSLKSSILWISGSILCLFLLTYKFDTRTNDTEREQPTSYSSKDDNEIVSPMDDVVNIRKQFFVGSTQEGIRKSTATNKPQQQDKPKNVLFLITDDMRPQLGCYAGRDFANPTMQQKMSTPNLDKLASKSLLLRRAYTQYSLCGPSRASMMTSRRPDSTRIYGNNLYWRMVGGNYTTLPQYFKEHGYRTIGMGKIYHQFESSNYQDPISWSEPHFEPPYADGHYYKLDDAGYMAVSAQERETISPLTDEHSILKAKKTLQNIASDTHPKTPFFLALGFSKPHLNFVCPKKYFSMYDIERGEQYMSDLSWQTPIVGKYCNMANVSYEGGDRLITDEGLRHLRRAYFACISFVDGMVGELLAELERLGLADDTIVSFVSDHGHHLGENGYWGKQTNYESSTHIPMMIHIPGLTDHGVVTRSLVEAVDLYPTIVEAAGLGKLEPCPRNSYDLASCTEGTSLLPLIDSPDQPVKPAAYSQTRITHSLMQYTIRTDRYKFIQHATVKKANMENGRDKYSLQWDKTSEYWTALFDLDLDPEEKVNRTDHTAYAKVRELLETKLHEAFIGVQNVRRITS